MFIDYWGLPSVIFWVTNSLKGLRHVTPRSQVYGPCPIDSSLPSSIPVFYPNSDWPFWTHGTNPQCPLPRFTFQNSFTRYQSWSQSLLIRHGLILFKILCPTPFFPSHVLGHPTTTSSSTLRLVLLHLFTKIFSPLSPLFRLFVKSWHWIPKLSTMFIVRNTLPWDSFCDILSFTLISRSVAPN